MQQDPPKRRNINKKLHGFRCQTTESAYSAPLGTKSQKHNSGLHWRLLVLVAPNCRIMLTGYRSEVQQIKYVRNTQSKLKILPCGQFLSPQRNTENYLKKKKIKILP
jgi:hypothetical protein